MRDIGLEDAAYKVGTYGEPIQNMRWCHSLLGEEYGRNYSWGGAPKTKFDVLNSSPCRYVDLPQTVMEPLFVKYATDRGIPIRFSTKLNHVERKDGFVYSTVEDLCTKSVYQVKSRYIFGCDGGRSTVARSLNAKFSAAPSGGVACNILLEADVGDRMQDRLANLHWVVQPDVNRKFGMSPVIRMIKPWFQWMIVCFTPDAVRDPFEGLTKDSPELHQYVKDVFGDQSLKVKILRLDPWVIRETVAEKFSDGHDVFMARLAWLYLRVDS
jgi:2-polyprenyl-6-methoxyphenol hydroxylase-like FAD-dependent oxidoreductase